MTFNPDNPQEHKEYNQKLVEFNKFSTFYNIIKNLKDNYEKQLYV